MLNENTPNHTQVTMCVRNWALIVVGFFGALRRSELADRPWKSAHFQRDGLLLILQRSKIDQARQGQQVAILIGSSNRYAL